jgi:hypothetical protein
VLKLELLQAWPRFRNDLAATSAMLAALLITLSTTGDFGRKWQANRIAAAAMENLAYRLLALGNADDLRSVIVEIQTINDERNRGIVGEQSARPTSEALRYRADAKSGSGDTPQAARH